MKKTTIALLSLLILCACKGSVQHQLDEAEALMMTEADSAQHILEGIPSDAITSDEEVAVYNLLHTWALFRNYAKEIPQEPLHQAYEYFKNSTDAHRRAQVHYLHSVVEEDQRRGDPGEWLQDLYEACMAVEHCDDHLLAAKIYQRYGGKKYDAADHAEARKWDLKYVEAARQTKLPKEIVLALINLSLAQTYAERDSLQKLLNTTDGEVIAHHTTFREGFNTMFEALKIAQDNHLATEEGKIYGNLAIFYSYRQMPDSTLCYALKAVKIDEQQFAKGERRDPVRYVHVCDAYRKLGMADSAIYYGLKDVNYPSLQTRRNATQLLYCIYSDLNDYQNSLYWLQRNKAIEDSIHRGLESQQFNATEAAAEQKVETEKAKAQVHKSQSWLLTTLVATSIFIALAFVAVVHNRRKYYKQLQMQEAEINRLLREAALQKSRQVIEKATQQPDNLPTDPSNNRNIGPTNNRIIDPSNPRDIESSNPRDIDPSNNRITEQPNNRITEQPNTPSTITLAGNTKEELKINPDDVLYLTSEGNYIKVAYLDAEQHLKTKLLRQTMTAIGNTLSDSTIITRCHRAFYVNLKHVTHASTVPAGLMLRLDKSSTPIPVSRSYIADIKEKLSAKAL